MKILLRNPNNTKFNIITRYSILILLSFFLISHSQIEHPSVLEVFKYFDANYSDRIHVHYLPVDELGSIKIDEFVKIVSPSTLLISVMHANNETGVIQPIEKLVKIAKEINPDILFHTDAAQSIGKIAVDVKKMNVDFLSVCSHKFYGPKGIGALYIKNGCEEKLEKLIHGANHEKNLRAGTENILEIVGLGRACELVSKELNTRIAHFKNTRNTIWRILSSSIQDVVLQGPPIDLDNENTNENRLSNTLFVSFPNVEANLILDSISDKIACSAGAACHSDEVKLSHVLESMKVPSHIAMGTIRISTGLGTTSEEAKDAAYYIVEIVNKLSSKKETNEENSISYSNETCQLTKTTHGLGCGCKISPKVLNNLLKSLPIQKSVLNNPAILVGNETSDDSCVYKLDNETALIKSLDFLTPICDSPADYGAIACANALSDIYAMGGKPLLALNIVCFPIKILSANILKDILLGAQLKAEEANVPILGGHSIEDNEPKFGMSVTGIGHPEFIWKNSDVSPNDVIILTKKIGVGLIMTAVKKGFIKNEEVECKEAIESMKRLNKYHCDALREMEGNKVRVVSACTDVTGFGLLGHLKECLEPKKMSANINYGNIGFLKKAKEIAEMEIIPGGTANNYLFTSSITQYDENLSKSEKYLINDAQTSGGLLIFVQRDKLQGVEKKFKEKNLDYFIIGEVIDSEKGETKIIINK